MNQSKLLRKTAEIEKLPQPTPAATKAKSKAASSKTLRDEFAMSALDHATSVYTKMTLTELDRLMGRKTYSKDDAVARLAYNMADAMLAARES